MAPPSLSRRKCLIGAALVAEIIVFSAVTFVIAYVNSLNSIHHASQRLADSMVDTVAVRVTGYISTTENALHNLAVTRRDAMLPEDYDNTTLGPAWSTEWSLGLRTVLMAMKYDVYAVAMQLDDASIVGAAIARHQWLSEVVLDARLLPYTGYRTVTAVLIDIATKVEIPNGLLLTDWPNGRSYWSQQSPGYYTLLSLFGKNTSWCAWTPLVLDSDLHTFDTCLTCAVLNASGHYLGQLATLRDIAAITSFLQQAAITPNAEIFVFDDELFLISATTTSTPTSIVRRVNASESLVMAPGCVSSGAYVDTETVLIGCRASVYDYPYEPLRSLAHSDLELLQTPTRRSAYRQLTDSMAYYIVCLPVVNSGYKRSLHLVLFLPEEDVLADIQQGLQLSIAICVLLCVMGASLSSFLVAALVGAPQPRLRSAAAARNEGPYDVGDGVTVATMRTSYDAVLEQCRFYDRLSREQGGDAGSGLRRAAGCSPPESSSAFSSAASLPAAAIAPLASSATAVGDPAAVRCMAVALLLRCSGDVQSSDSSTSAPNSAASNLEAALAPCVDEHGGRLVPVPDLGEGNCVAAIWLLDADDALDHPDLRAVLCGLALLRLHCVTAAAVARGDVLRYHSDPFRQGTLLQDAMSMLPAVSAAGEPRRAEAHVVASVAVLRNCTTPNVLLTRDTVTRGPPAREVLGLTTPNKPKRGGGDGFGLRPRVHFARRAAPLHALLNRSLRNQQQQQQQQAAGADVAEHA